MKNLSALRQSAAQVRAYRDAQVAREKEEAARADAKLVAVR